LCSLALPPPGSLLFPYTTLFRSADELALAVLVALHQILALDHHVAHGADQLLLDAVAALGVELVEAHGLTRRGGEQFDRDRDQRSEEHTSELQSRENLVCRLLLE